MIKFIGKVENLAKWLSWCHSFENNMIDENWNGKKTLGGKKELWFGKGVKLGFNNKIYEGLSLDNLVEVLKNEWEWKNYLKGWGCNSCLLYKYNVGCELRLHKDRNIFDNKVIIVNLGDCEFVYGDKVYKLVSGVVVEIDNQVFHGVKPVNSERWSLSFRKVK